MFGWLNQRLLKNVEKTLVLVWLYQRLFDDVGTTVIDGWFRKR